MNPASPDAPSRRARFRGTGFLLLFSSAVAAMLLGVSCQPVCDATTCPDGCCGEDGICWVGNTHDECGLNGAACTACRFSQLCSPQGQCVSKCDPVQCASGCCNEAGSCTTPNDLQCGLGGADCVDCGSALGCNSQGQCSACGEYQAPCDGDEDCCLGRTCQYDSLFGEDRCQ